MFMIYWIDEAGVAQGQREDSLVAALELAKQKRDEGRRFVTMASEDPNSVGKPGVDAVENGKTPDGSDYTWSKAGRAGRSR